MDGTALLAAVGFFAAIIVYVWLKNKAKAKLGEAVNKHILSPKDHRLQEELWNTEYRWSTTATWREVADNLTQKLVQTSGGTQILSQTEDAMLLGFNFTGMRFHNGSIHFGVLPGISDTEYEFQATLSRDPSDNGGQPDRTVLFSFTQMRTSEGVARCVEEMRQLLSDVESTIRTIDPAATSLAPPAKKR